MTIDTVEQYAQAIIDVGAEVDSHIDGYACIQTFTFNEAQLVAFVELVARAERANVVEWAKNRLDAMEPKYDEAMYDLLTFLSNNPTPPPTSLKGTTGEEE